MKTIVSIFALSLAVGFGARAQSSIPEPAVQIKTAVLAASSDKRDGATVYGYDARGNLVLLRKGTNDMVCLADDPAEPGFSVSCYHKDLEPFMARGRELRTQGKSAEEIFNIREAEAKAGKLSMPEHPNTLFVYYAPKEDYDAKTGEVKNGRFRYVIYIPYATAATTGLPLKPEVPGMPWLMNPGTHRAHIMITPQ